MLYPKSFKLSRKVSQSNWVVRSFSRCGFVSCDRRQLLLARGFSTTCDNKLSISSSSMQRGGENLTWSTMNQIGCIGSGAGTIFQQRGIGHLPLHKNTSLFVQQQQFRFFQSESEYHTVADETLEDIQDAVESALEDSGLEENFELTFASGVLTMSFPPHGTWVVNKQTPNRQIWWSSPLSGPRRYEYENDEWVFTRDDTHSMTLYQAMKDEVQQIYDVEIDL